MKKTIRLGSFLLAFLLLVCTLPVPAWAASTSYDLSRALFRSGRESPSKRWSFCAPHRFAQDTVRRAATARPAAIRAFSRIELRRQGVSV